MTRLLALAIVLAAPATAQVPQWAAAAKPTLVIGGDASDAADPNNQFAGITAALRLANGHIIVANSDPVEIREFDAQGKFVRQVGRRGRGPGEYRGRLTITVVPGDSLLAFDDDDSQWSLYSPTAKLMRSFPAPASVSADYLPTDYRQSIVHPVGKPLSACYAALIASLPVPHDTGYREVFPDGPDRAWFREEGSGTWLVRSLAGPVIGRVELPADLQLLQIGDGFVIGIRRDADHVERVEMRAVAMPRHHAAPPCAARTAGLPADTSRLVRWMRVDARNSQTASAAYWSDYRRYPASYKDIAGNIVLSPGDLLAVQSSDSSGFDAVVHNPKAHGFCRILAGDAAPVWLYRYAWCGEKS